MSDERTDNVFEEFVDFLLPSLTPYETTIYLYLLRKSHFSNGASHIRIGKRTIAKDCGQGSRSSRGTFEHTGKMLQSLEAKGCISIGNTNRDGTIYTVKLPREVPAAKERMAELEVPSPPLNYFRDPDLRKELFERDKWACRYCGERVTTENATLDHLIPISKGGPDSPENLATCCLLCNSIKSGKTYEEAAPAILAALRKRRDPRASE